MHNPNLKGARSGHTSLPRPFPPGLYMRRIVNQNIQQNHRCKVILKILKSQALPVHRMDLQKWLFWVSQQLKSPTTKLKKRE